MFFSLRITANSLGYMRWVDCKTERTARSQLALTSDAAAMQLNDLATEIKPESGGSIISAAASRLPETLKQLWFVGLRNAFSCVCNLYLSHRWCLVHRDVDTAAGGRELEGIIDEVLQNAAQLFCVA